MKCDLTRVYPGLGSDELRRDVRLAYDAVRALRDSPVADVDPLLAEVTAKLGDVHAYCTALISTGEDVGAANAMLRMVSAISAEQHRALRKDDVEERMIATFGPEAFRAWIKLYERLSDELVVQGQSLGEALGLLEHPEEAERRAAWHAIHEAWRPHESTVAAILSSVVAYRMKVLKLRARSSGEDCVTPSLRENRVSRATVDALFEVLDRRRVALERAPRLLARLLDKPHVEPWDLAASSPAAEAPISLERALEAIRGAFAVVDPEMGGFVEEMQRKRLIDARPRGPGRRHGAYQTSFVRTKESLVFANYDGRRLDVTTLAHELGHAFHHWVTRDGPPEAHKLPPALAETASSFAEIALEEHWLERAPHDPIEARHYAWVEAQNATAFLLVMPASFTFERGLYEARGRGPLEAADLSERLAAAWRERFGSSMTIADDRGWLRKHHFTNARAFYNYPYMFGWLLAVLLEAERQRDAKAFPPFLRTFLERATTLTFDELVETSFGESPQTTHFWERALDRVEERLARAEALFEEAKQSRVRGDDVDTTRNDPPRARRYLCAPRARARRDADALLRRRA